MTMVIELAFFVGTLAVVGSIYAGKNIALMTAMSNSTTAAGSMPAVQMGWFHSILLLNPATGYPYENGLVSVTIISPASADGDALSTTCFALGLKEGMKLIDSLPDIYAVFLTEDEELHYSEGFLEHITLIP